MTRAGLGLATSRLSKECSTTELLRPGLHQLSYLENICKCTSPKINPATLPYSTIQSRYVQSHLFRYWGAECSGKDNCAVHITFWVIEFDIQYMVMRLQSDKIIHIRSTIQSSKKVTSVLLLSQLRISLNTTKSGSPKSSYIAWMTFPWDYNGVVVITGICWVFYTHPQLFTYITGVSLLFGIFDDGS